MAPREFLDKIKYEALFHLLAAELQTEFVGKLLRKDLMQSLRNCKMWVQQGAKAVKLNVTEHYVKFANCVSLLDMAVPFACNLPATYFDTLDSNLKARIESNKYELPDTTALNAQQLTQLQELRDHAVAAEKDIQSQFDIALLATNRYPVNAQAAAYPAAFMTTLPDTRAPVFTLAPADTTSQMLSWPPAEHQGIYQPSSPVNLAFQHCAAVYHSIAETALRDAYGEQSYQVRCYGCEELYPEDCFHRFLACPHCHDPRVQQAALPKLEQFLQCKHHCRQPKCDEGGMTLEQRVAAWKKDGFRSAAVANFVHSMAATTSLADRDRLQQEFRTVASDALFSDKDTQRQLSQETMETIPSFPVQPVSQDFRQQVSPPVGNSTKRTRWHPSTKSPNKDHICNEQTTYDLSQLQTRPIAFHLAPSDEGSQRLQQVFGCTQVEALAPSQVSIPIFSVSPSPIMMSTALPHIQLLVGNTIGVKFLEGLYDSGAGLTVGSRSYHEQIISQHPDVVATVRWFEKEGIDPIPLGGIAHGSAAPMITAAVTYKLPYRCNGHPSTLQVALADNITVRTIFGTPFHRAAKLTYQPHVSSVSSSLWGISFPIAFKKTDPVQCTVATGHPAVLRTTGNSLS